jgi:hypothetical protein
MIICLYYSNYPIEKNGTPDWKSLPIGYFQIDEKTLESELSTKNTVLNGRFLYNQGKPRIGEHLLSVFSLNGKNYIYNSTISYRYEIESDPDNKDNFNADLGLLNIIKEWETVITGF